MGGLFHSTDEDALNFALMLTDARIDAQGPEAMGFLPNGHHHHLSHAVGAIKPWQGRHLRRMLRGERPAAASRWYYRFAAGPLTPLPYHLLIWQRASLTLAGLLGRILDKWVRLATRTTTSAAFSAGLRSAVVPRTR